MPESKDLTLTQPADPTAVKVVKRGSLGLKRRLQKLRFDPSRFLIHQVMPQLSPRDQARVCLELLQYEYPKMKSQEVATGSRARREKGPQTNIQINLPGGENKTAYSVEDLIAIAAENDDQPKS